MIQGINVSNLYPSLASAVTASGGTVLSQQATYILAQWSTHRFNKPIKIGPADYGALVVSFGDSVTGSTLNNPFQLTNRGMNSTMGISSATLITTSDVIALIAYQYYNASTWGVQLVVLGGATDGSQYALAGGPTYSASFPMASARTSDRAAITLAELSPLPIASAEGYVYEHDVLVVCGETIQPQMLGVKSVLQSVGGTSPTVNGNDAILPVTSYLGSATNYSTFPTNLRIVNGAV